MIRELARTASKVREPHRTQYLCSLASWSAKPFLRDDLEKRKKKKKEKKEPARAVDYNRTSPSHRTFSPVCGLGCREKQRTVVNNMRTLGNPPALSP